MPASLAAIRSMLALGIMLAGSRYLAAQTLETETARSLPAGVIEVANNFEYQVSSEGHETALPLAFEIGVTGGLELLVEPVPYTSIRPKAGPRASGVGDLEITVTQRISRETSVRPAFAVAGEIKIPTTKNDLIGTGKTDYAAYLIASKRFGALDAHANLGYTIVGQPAGTRLSNIANFALGGIYDVGSRTKLFAEVLGNTASAAGGAAESSATPEVAGGELVGTVGVGRTVWQRLFLSMGLSYDNNGAVLFRPGFTLRVN